MLLIPAIDLKGGQCVRLTQGRPEAESVYSNQPEKVALQWETQGAARLHIIDLDGAFAGSPRNLEVVKAITATVSIPVHLGGGLRNLEAVEEVLATGVRQVILGTRAAQDPGFLEEALARFGDRIIVGVDARDGRVAIKGWKETLPLTSRDLVLQLAATGVKTVIYTDVSRDGTLQGPNLESLEGVLGLGVDIIAAGGISSLDDLLALQKLARKGLVGVILGKALYTGDIDLAEALDLVRGKIGTKKGGEADAGQTNNPLSGC